MWDTEQNNGVLLYLLLADRDVEIVADRGFNGKVAPVEWESVCRVMEAHLAAGRSLFVFPEGTRSPDGNLIAFYRGAFWMSARYKVPIVPVLIEGTRGILPKHQLFISPRPVRVRILPPIDPSLVDYDSRKLRDLTRERLRKGQRRTPVTRDW